MNRYAFKLVVGVSALVVCGFFMTPFEAVASQTGSAPPVEPVASGQDASHMVVHPQSGEALPAALRPALYGALAKDSGAADRLHGDGCAVLSKSGLKACFDGSGAHFTGANAPLTLHLAAYGRFGHLAAVNAVKPVIKDNQVSYEHGNLTAWWRVLPVGFEQGFTIANRPAGHGDLTLALATSRQDAGAPTIRHSRESGNPVGNTLAWGKLRYGGLVVTDAKGKVIPATLKGEGNRILIAVNDSHADYPLTVDPLVWLEQKVTASDGVANDLFGTSVAISGTTAVVGALNATVNGNPSQGAAYVFSDSGGTWTQTAKLTASDGTADAFFGITVALDGTTALVGAAYALVNGNLFQGAAYLFSDSTGTWTQTQKLTASDGAMGDLFGSSVALSDTTALVGANQGVSGGPGAAYVFSNSGGTFTQAAKLTASDGAEHDLFGFSVALEGTTALVSAPVAAVNSNLGQGAVYVFGESGGTWTQTAKLTASDGAAGDTFGDSVALDGTTALVGANYATVNGNNDQGAAYVFSNSGGIFQQTAKLTASDGAANDKFGLSVTLSGTTALVGASYATVNGNSEQGADYVFGESGGVWTQTAKLTASDGAEGDLFGSPVALAGATALIGAVGDTVNGNSSQGAAYFYGESNLDLALSAPQTVGQGQQYVSQTIATNNSSAATPAVSETIAVPAAASFVSATASQGSCGEDSGVVTCDFGQINGNAGTATANVTLKAIGDVGDTIENVAGIAKATPPLSASAATTITAGGACPDGYAEYDGTLNPGEVVRSPVYQAPGGQENAILTAPARFELYAVYQSGRFGRHVYLVPGNEVHRWGPKGLYMWLVRARDGAGAYTLCVLHP